MLNIVNVKHISDSGLCAILLVYTLIFLWKHTSKDIPFTLFSYRASIS